MLPTIPFWGLMLWSIAFEMEKDRDMEKKQKMKEYTEKVSLTFGNPIFSRAHEAMSTPKDCLFVEE